MAVLLCLPGLPVAFWSVLEDPFARDVDLLPGKESPIPEFEALHPQVTQDMGHHDAFG